MSSSRAHSWSRLHADLTSNYPAMVDLLVDHGRAPVFILQTGSDGLSDDLRAVLDKDVWSTDSVPHLANWRRKRFLCGDLRWIHKHPRLRHDVPSGFAAIVAAAPIWPAFESSAEARATITALHSLVQAGGALHLLEPGEVAPPEPRLSSHSGVLCLQQEVGGQRHEVRATAGSAPIVNVGPNLDVPSWEEVLCNAGFTQVTHQALRYGYTLVSALKSPADLTPRPGAT